MKVYKLTEELVAKRGVYNGIWKFDPIVDADGNYICSLADGENENYPFAAQIRACSKIDYKPVINPI